MLYISTHQNECDYILRFELQDYYRRRDRSVVAEQQLDTFEANILVNDPLFYERMIDYIITGIGCEIDGLIGGDKYPCQILYPFFRNSKDVLRLDREYYLYKKERQLCKELCFQYSDAKALGEDNMLKSKIGRIICQYLPLGPFPHILDETVPKVPIEFDMKKPQFYDGWTDER